MLNVKAFPAGVFAAAILIVSYTPPVFAFDNGVGQFNLPVDSSIKMTQLESESGGVFFGGGESESGGVYESGAETETGGATNSGASTETGGATNSGASSETGGPTNAGAETETGGANNAGSQTESGGPGVEIRNY